MDSGGVLLVNLAKGRLGLSADLFGALLMADIEARVFRPLTHRSRVWRCGGYTPRRVALMLQVLSGPPPAARNQQEA